MFFSVKNPIFNTITIFGHLPICTQRRSVYRQKLYARIAKKKSCFKGHHNFKKDLHKKMSNTKHVQQFVSPGARDQVYSKRFPNIGPYFGMRKTVLDFDFYPIAREVPTVNQYCRLVVEADDLFGEDMSMMMSQPMGSENILNVMVQVVAVRHCKLDDDRTLVAVHAVGEGGGRFVWNHETLELTTCTTDPSFEGSIMENVYNPLFSLTVNRGVRFDPNNVRDMMQYNQLYCDETIDYRVSANDLPVRSLACH